MLFFSAQATVLLAVNVSFMAIQDVAPTVDAVTTGFVASLSSTVTSIGCIVVGLLLVNEDYTNPKHGRKASVFAICYVMSFIIATFIVDLLHYESEI